MAERWPPECSTWHPTKGQPWRRKERRWRWLAVRLPVTGQLCFAWVTQNRAGRQIVGGSSMCPAAFERAWERTEAHLYRDGDDLRAPCVELARGGW